MSDKQETLFELVIIPLAIVLLIGVWVVAGCIVIG